MWKESVISGQTMLLLLVLTTSGKLIIAPIQHLHTNKTKLLSVKKYHKDFQHVLILWLKLLIEEKYMI